MERSSQVWAPKWTGAPEKLRSLAAAAAFLALGLLRASQWHAYRSTFIWCLETTIFFGLAVAYLYRVSPVARPDAPREYLLPYVGAALPFSLLLLPLAESCPMTLATSLVAAGEVLNLAGLWSLGRGFGISVAARVLVTGGVYRFLRHPIYLGQILTTSGLALFREPAPAVGILVVFVAVQVARARMEERKLTEAFPAYARYRGDTPAWLGRRGLQEGR